MFEFRILLFFLLAFDSYSDEIREPNIPWTDVHVTIFDKKSLNYEKDLLYESMQEHKKGGTASLHGRIVVGTLGAVAGAIPIAGGFVQFLLSFADMLTIGSDWQNSLSQAIRETEELSTAHAKASDLVARIHSIHNSLGLAESKDKDMIVWDTRKDLDYMMNIFDSHDSIFKKYPSIGAPILINLSKLIARLSPEINNPYISCKMRKILIEYRNRTLDARLDQIEYGFVTKNNFDEARPPYWDYRIYQRYDMVFIRAHIMALKYTKSIKEKFSESKRWTCEKLLYRITRTII